MTRRFALLATLNLVLFTTGGMAEPWVKKYDPPTAYSIEKPAYAYFKDIAVTRKSSRDVDINITLQGPIPKNMPKDYGINYYVYFDLDEYETDRTKKTKEGFQSDCFIQVGLAPNAFSSREFKAEVVGANYRSKLWVPEVTDVRASGDKVSFSVKFNLFAEKNVPFLMKILSSTPHWEGGNASQRNEKTNASVHMTKPFDLPTK